MTPRIVFHSKISRSVRGDALKVRLTQDLTKEPAAGSSSDDEYLSDSELAPEAGRSWSIASGRFRFGYHSSTGAFHGTEVKQTSHIPICDRVLTLNGDLELSDNSKRVIRKLSELLTESARLHVNDGAFDCVAKVAKGEGGIYAQLTGDRQFPYFYAQDAPRIRGFVFHEVQVDADSRVIKFVKVSGSAWLSDDLRGEILYLLPLGDHSENS